MVFSEQDLFTDYFERCFQFFLVFTQVLDKLLPFPYTAALGMLQQTASLTNIQR